MSAYSFSRSFLRLGAIALLSCFSLGLAGHANEKSPNVILILVDDMGWMDLTCQGSDFYKTPNIDRLAKEGMLHQWLRRLRRMFPHPGRRADRTLPHRLGVTDWIRSFFNGRTGYAGEKPTESSGQEPQAPLPAQSVLDGQFGNHPCGEFAQKWLQDAYIGKWHLGDEAWYPEKQGYHENFGGCDYGQPPRFSIPTTTPSTVTPRFGRASTNCPEESPENT